MVGIKDFHSLSLRRGVLIVGVFILSPQTAAAQARYTVDRVRSELTFEARSTTGHFTGTAADVFGWASLADTASLASVRGEVRVKVATVHTGIGLRDHDLRSEMQVDRFPEVVLTIDSARSQPVRDAAREAELHGAITLHGVTRRLTAAAALHFAGDTLVVTGRIPMRFTDFAMKPPTRAFGILRVKDEWEIVYSTRFVRVH